MALEIISLILDYLPVADLIKWARVARRTREMVYDDAKWVPRLRAMGCWNEAAARATTGTPRSKAPEGRGVESISMHTPVLRR